MKKWFLDPVFKGLLFVFVGLTSATQVNAAAILITEMDFGPAAYTDMQTNLQAAGHTVDIVNVTTAGTLATTLASTAYDQVFLYDLASTLYLNGADTAALAAFWDTRGLVVDTRSYGYFFQGNDPSEVALIQNVAANLDAAGGGVWVGSDHDPTWTNNANAFLSAAGINPITGSFSDAVNFADPTSVLLSGVTPTDLWGAGASVGSAPIGIQPNGVEMFIHFGHERPDGSILPYISASFPLTGVNPVPEPGMITLFGLGLLGLGLARRRKRS